MALTDKQQVVSEGNLPEAFESNSKLDSHLWKAERRLRSLLTDAVYDEIAGETGTDRLKDCRLAEANLTLYYAIPALGLRVTNEGGLVQSIGMQQTNKRLVNHRDLQDIAAGFKDTAMELLSPYVPDPNEDDPEDDDIMNADGIGLIAI